jgi:hypothetical protein
LDPRQSWQPFSQTPTQRRFRAIATTT